MDNLNEALWIMLKGLAVVFLVMSLIAGGTWLSGRFFMAWDKGDRKKKKALEEQKKAEKARKKAEKARKKAEEAEKAKEEKAKEAPSAQESASTEKVPRASQAIVEEEAKSKKAAGSVDDPTDEKGAS